MKWWGREGNQMKLGILWNFSYFTVIDKIKEKVKQAGVKRQWGEKKTAVVYFACLLGFIWGTIFTAQELTNLLLPDPTRFIVYGFFMLCWCGWLGVSMFAEMTRMKRKIDEEIKEGYEKGAAEDLAIATEEKPAAQPQAESA